MNKDRIPVAYLARSPEDRSAVNAALLGDPSIKLNQQDVPLGKLNGKAVEFVHGSRIVIFEAGDKAEEDEKAIRTLRESLPDTIPIVAVASANASLADVRRLTNAGVDDVIPDTMDALELQQQVPNWIAQRAPVVVPEAQLSTDGKVIAVARSRGGIGATTVAVNVADALLGRQGTFRKRTTKKVALVDFDLQFGAIASHLDIEGGEATYQMLLDGTVPDETFLSTALVQHKSGLSVLPAPANFVPLDSMSAQQVSRIIEVLRATHDYVVIDLPHALVDWLAAVIERTDELLLVTDSSVPSVRQAKRLMDFFTAENLKLEVTIVVNHEKKPVLPRRHHTEASKVLDREFKHWLPFDPKAAREASDRGVPMSEAAGQSALTKSLSRLGRYVAEDHQKQKSGKSGANS